MTFYLINATLVRVIQEKFNKGERHGHYKQIAELAGVSRGTVDRVLNNRGSVNANTAARVREIAEKLNYKPNKAGLMLAAQKKNLKIGVILFPDSNPFFSEVLEGVNAKAKELSAYNFTVLIRQVPFDETEQF